jgi:hypothetical protein
MHRTVILGRWLGGIVATSISPNPTRDEPREPIGRCCGAVDRDRRSLAVASIVYRHLSDVRTLSLCVVADPR